MALLWLVNAGCSDPAIQSYRVPKESTPAPMATPGRMPHLHWDLPSGWEEVPPDRLRMASFKIAGADGGKAEMAIIPLPGVTNQIELESVNLWREDLQLAPLPQEGLASQASEVSFGGLPARWYDMSSATNRTGEKFRRRTIGVILERGNALWFAKMTGDEPVVAQEAAKLRTFLERLTFDETDHSAPAPAMAARPAHSGDLPKWTVPAHWQSKTPGAMVSVAFGISGGSGQADVTISKLAGDGGGWLGNVNRWRGQLSLPPTTEGEVPKATTFLEVGGQQAPRIELAGSNSRTGRDERMIVVAVRQGSETWYYKLMGEPGAVEAEKETFAKFIQSAY